MNMMGFQQSEIQKLRLETEKYKKLWNELTVQ
jgi:hypothetical protein